MELIGNHQSEIDPNAIWKDGTTWMWAADAPEEDDTWKFTENGDGFSFLARLFGDI